MTKLTLSSIDAGYASIAQLNANFTSIQAEFQDKVLYRDNTSLEDNVMENDLDMNSNRIINLPSATSNSEPATYGQLLSLNEVVEFTGTVSEVQSATAGQTAFTLTLTTYTPGIANLSVYINGNKQTPSTYTETSTTVVTLSEGCDLGDTVELVVNTRPVDASSVDAASVTNNGTTVAAEINALQALVQTGSGSPEGAVTAVVGSLYTRTDGGASTTLYVKESGAGNTGWVAK